MTYDRFILKIIILSKITHNYKVAKSFFETIIKTQIKFIQKKTLVKIQPIA